MQFGVFWKMALEKWKMPSGREVEPFGVWGVMEMQGLRLDISLKDKPIIFEEMLRNCV